MSAPANSAVIQLLDRARAGDRLALGRLFEMCRNYLRVVAQAQGQTWLKAKFDASDLVQQTLLEGYRDFADFHGATEAEWLGWLRRILARNAADFARHYHGTAKRHAGREVALGAAAGSSSAAWEPADGGESPSQQLLRKERELQVADALARLSPEHREVIILRNLQRLPFDEVACRMGRSRPAAQMLWMRAIACLQRGLAEEAAE